MNDLSELAQESGVELAILEAFADEVTEVSRLVERAVLANVAAADHADRMLYGTPQMPARLRNEARILLGLDALEELRFLLQNSVGAPGTEMTRPVERGLASVHLLRPDL